MTKTVTITEEQNIVLEQYAVLRGISAASLLESIVVNEISRLQGVLLREKEAQLLSSFAQLSVEDKEAVLLVASDKASK